MTYVLATANPGKIKEMQDILETLGIEVKTRDSLGINVEIEETGTTFIENATLKAKEICKLSGLPAIADDSGISIDALSGGPGVYSSSYGGDNLTTEERNIYLLNVMENTEHRAAKYVSTIVCVFPNGDLINATGECKGTIARKIKGTGGFGYDSVFIPDGYTRTMAEISIQEKNAISHRGKALKKFAVVLKNYTGQERQGY